MPISVAASFDIPAKNYSRGIKRFWFANQTLTFTVVSNAITAFAGGTGAMWFSIELPDGAGDISAVPSFGSGGLEYATTGNLIQGGSDTDTLVWAQNFITSNNVQVVAEYNDGTYKYFGEVSHNGGAGITSGVAGGADNGIALQFGGFMYVTGPQAVTVATTLQALTTTT